MTRVSPVFDMIDPVWTDVDEYLGKLLTPHDAALDAALMESRLAELPPISVTAAQGKFLHLLARLVNAKSILEIGTLGGYSTIWLARALAAGGRLVSLERNAMHARVAEKNVARAGLAELVNLRIGDGVELLDQMVRDHTEPFDMIFIDADKKTIPDFYERSLALSRPGTLIIVDNVIRGGAVADASSTDPDVMGVRRFNELLSRDTRASAATLQTVGSKGYDGFTLAVVR